jgi:DNA-binding SARP family transcriptional activator
MTESSDQAGKIDLQVLGAFAVRHNGALLDLPQSRKTRALLAYLAVVDEPQRREQLCELFWDAPDDLRASLRWSLSKIRKIVNIDRQDVLDADRHQVALRAQSIALDLRQVRALSERLSSAGVAELEAAAAVLKGGFLADLSLPRCRQFESWRLALENEVHRLRAMMLRALVDRLSGEPARALPHALALQAMDPGNSTLAAEARALTAAARQSAVATPAAAPIVEGQRQDVTILSIGIVSPLHGFASVAPDVLLRQLDPLFESAHMIIQHHGGMVTASGGSGIVALFGSASSDNHALAACRAALAVKSVVESESAGSVRVRGGLDSGEVIVRHRREGTAVRIEVTGVALRTAERLVHSLRRGVLAITDRTQLVAAGLVATSVLPRSEFPRFGRDGQVYELLSDSGSKPATGQPSA